VNEVLMQGQVALVTGASRGIGAAIALRLAQSGMKVIGTATSDDGVSNIAHALGAYQDCVGHVLNVNDGVAGEALISEIVAMHGGLHVLINNAGITRDNLSMRLKDDDWNTVLDTNLTSVFRMSRSCMRTMMKQKYGRIINITSVVGASGNPGQVNYAAAKAGVAGMTRSMAKELGSRNITVNCVAPGFIATDMTLSLSKEQHAAWIAQIPMGRLGTPAEVAHLVAFLANPNSAYITGQELHINGGLYS
jgi:3-oxoacyl-[acyl-carrier protein] reductase